MSDVFYNENDPYAATWLKNLSEAGHIAPGEVDDRSIVALEPADVREFRQAHFFAGIGVWSYALRLAGWPDDAPVWTGSCPCQPFSQSGRRQGFDDKRHLWPAWFRLIEKCRPPVVVGEQVAGADGLKWLDVVLADLEGAGYAVGAADLCAAGVGAPHLRQRLFFVAVSREQRRTLVGKARVHGRRQAALGDEAEAREAHGARRNDDARRGTARELADAERDRRYEQRGERGQQEGPRQRRDQPIDIGGALKLGHASGEGSRRDAGAVPRAQGEVAREGVGHRRRADKPTASDPARVLGDAGRKGSSLGPRPEERFGAVRYEGPPPSETGATRGFWADAEWWLCRDGKARPARPGTFPLVDGAPARVGRLRAYGNAIVAEAAATFIRAVLDGQGGAHE